LNFILIYIFPFLHLSSFLSTLFIALIFILFFQLISFNFLFFLFCFSSEGDFEDFEEPSETAEAIAALKESIFNMLAGFH